MVSNRFAGHQGAVSSVAFSSERELVSAEEEWSCSGHVQSWDVAEGTPFGQRRHTGEILSLAVSPRAAFLAAGGEDHTVTLWRLSK